ncbi:hypothetical protein [Tenacibaculum piscium]|uniref:hypothetical protein n=1 Tax=Tenacibaculum piscium TaxID=1458515 RepID=UPI001F28EF0A|nr:hypothetical protein [Tenacibaculum piscium]
MSRKNNDYFWLGYADLMTSLFFIMLVLFVLVFSIMQYKTAVLEENSKVLEEKLIENEIVKTKLESANKKLLADAIELKRIRSINETLKALENGGNFKYNPICKRFELSQTIMFSTNSAAIPRNQEQMLIRAGKELKSLINSFAWEINIKFLIVIEGRAAKHENERLNLKYDNNVKDLSYSRSLALYSLWKKANVMFNSNNSEIMISGSGFDGVCRYTGVEEGKNKRFIIQIIPYLIK